MPAYNPPPSPWSVLGRGAMGIGGLIRDMDSESKARELAQKQYSDTIAHRDRTFARAGDWREEDLARGDEQYLTNLALQYGAQPVPSVGAGVRGVEGDGGTVAPTAGPSTGAPAAVPGIGAHVRGGDMPTVSYQGRTLQIDPSRSVPGMMQAQSRTHAQEDAKTAQQRAVELEEILRAKGLGRYHQAPTQRAAAPFQLEDGVVFNPNTGAARPLSGPSGEPIRSTGGGAATEGERKSNIGFTRAEEASKTLDQLDMGNATSWVDKLPLVGGLGKMVLSDDERKFQQASDAFLTGVLRTESGATITDEELEQARRIYIPSSIDPRSVREQKRQARKVALDALRTAAGRAASPDEGAPQDDISALYTRYGLEPRR